jgi:glutathione S-transferase
MSKLFYTPGACSIGIHVLLEEIGKPYELDRVDLSASPPDRALTSVNPKSKVPTLQRDDGSTLTEFPAIAVWLAKTNPDKKLLGSTVEDEVRAIEAMDFAVSTIHMQGFSRLFRPSNFAPADADHDAVKARGREIVEKGFAVLDKALAGKDYITGAFSVADAALFYVEFWAAARMGIPLPTNVAAHFTRMKARPAVVATLKQEGLGA